MAGLLFCITGPSGAGKTSIARGIFPNECISITTRPMRDGEEHGVDYYFISKERYKELLDSGQLIEHEEYDGNYYGLTKSEVNAKTKQGPAFFVCTYGGLRQIRATSLNTVSIFLYASRGDCYSNMIARGDSIKKALQRMESYGSFMQHKGDFDYVLKNIRGDRSKVSVMMWMIYNAEVESRTNATKEEVILDEFASSFQWGD